MLSRDTARGRELGLKLVQGRRELHEVKFLLRRAIDASVSPVRSDYDLAAEIHKLEDRSRKAHGTYRVHRRGRWAPVVSGTMSQEGEEATADSLMYLQDCAAQHAQPQRRGSATVLL